MIGIEKPNVKIIELDQSGNECSFVVEPLARGYGITLRNSLRRILLSTLNGYAATSIKINGVLHEISTIEGVKEDVPEIVLNVKSIIPKLSKEAKGPKTVAIDAIGPAEVTAADIETDSDIEILNKEQHICTLSADARFHMEITFDEGRGYVSQEGNKQNYIASSGGVNAPIGTIFTDSIFAPVNRVEYKVENTRVGNITDYDKLTITVLTNGTLTAKEAIAHAAKVMYDHLNLFIDMSEDAKDDTTFPQKVGQETNDILNSSIDILELSVRSFHCLKHVPINTIGELINYTEDDLIKVRNLGKKSMEEVIAKLHELNLDLKKSED